MFGVAGADRSLALLAENTVKSAFFVYTIHKYYRHVSSTHFSTSNNNYKSSKYTKSRLIEG